MRHGQANAVSVPTRPRTGPSRHADVLDKALELFRQRGFAQVSMRDLAACLGIGAGSLYHHVDSKDALLQELIEDLYSELLAQANQVARRFRAPESRLDALVVAHLSLHRTMAAHFLVAERDFHCLGARHQDSILSLRHRYEAHFLVPLEQLVGRPGTPALVAAARGMVVLLNQLPAQRHIQVDDGLMRDMALGALRGAIDTCRGQ